MSYAYRKNNKIHYQIILPIDYKQSEDGQFATIVLVNGHTRPLNDLKSFARFLSKKNYRTILLDNRGSGLSDYKDDYTLEDIAEDIFMICREHEVKKISILGISMGGYIAQIFVKKYQQMVDNLILVSTNTNASTVFTDTKNIPNSTLEECEKKLKKYFSPNFLEKNITVLKNMCKQRLKQIKEDNYELKAISQRKAALGFDNLGELKNISIPTLVVHGELDNIIQVVEINKFRENIVNYSEVIYAGVGHLVLAECPRQFYDDVVNFLENNRKTQE